MLGTTMVVEDCTDTNHSDIYTNSAAFKSKHPSKTKQRKSTHESVFGCVRQPSHQSAVRGGSDTQYLIITASELSTSTLGPLNQCLADKTHDAIIRVSTPPTATGA